MINFREEDARLTFMRGDAVFMRNWPYVWNLLQVDDMSPVAGRVGIAPLPKGGEHGEHASILGGWQLDVSKFSKQPEVAADGESLSGCLNNHLDNGAQGILQGKESAAKGLAALQDELQQILTSGSQ